MIDNFIGIYKNAFSKDFCNRCIDYFNQGQLCGITENRLQNTGSNKTQIDDDALFAHSEMNFNYANTLIEDFNAIFWNFYNKDYAPNFSVLIESGTHNNYSFKIQKTKVGGGYHTWHYESNNRKSCHRLLVWMVYLNDVDDGGETEFLYQHKRIKPEAGTLVIWPAAFTHTHRGNPPLSNEKYIITGWIEF
jgi:hypothetical protein